MRKLTVCLLAFVFMGGIWLEAARTWEFGDEVQLGLLPNFSFEDPVLVEGGSFTPPPVEPQSDTFTRTDPNYTGLGALSDSSGNYSWKLIDSAQSMRIVNEKAVFDYYTYGGAAVNSALLDAPYLTTDVDVSVDWTLDWTASRNRQVGIRYRANPSVVWANAGYGYIVSFDRYNTPNTVSLSWVTAVLKTENIVIPGPEGVTTNNIRVVATGGNHKVYLNDALVLEYDDPVTSRQVAGSVGLRTAWSIGNFDNFVTNGIPIPLNGFTDSSSTVIHRYNSTDFGASYGAGQVIPEGQQVCMLNGGFILKEIPAADYVIEEGPVSFIFRVSAGVPLDVTASSLLLSLRAVDVNGDSVALRTMDLSEKLVEGEFTDLEVCTEVLADSSHVGKQLAVWVSGQDVDVDNLRLYVANHPCPGCYNAIPQASGDLNGDCQVDLADVTSMAAHWLECGLYPECVTGW